MKSILNWRRMLFSVSHQDNTRPGRNWYRLTGIILLHPHHTHPAFYLQITTYFGSYKILVFLKRLQFSGRLLKSLEQFMTQKDLKFWECGVMKLPPRWWKVVEQNWHIYSLEKKKKFYVQLSQYCTGCYWLTTTIGYDRQLVNRYVINFFRLVINLPIFFFYYYFL